MLFRRDTGPKDTRSRPSEACSSGLRLGVNSNFVRPVFVFVFVLVKYVSSTNGATISLKER